MRRSLILMVLVVGCAKREEAAPAPAPAPAPEQQQQAEPVKKPINFANMKVAPMAAPKLPGNAAVQAAAPDAGSNQLPTK